MVMIKNNILSIFLFFFVLFSALPLIGQAAELYLEPAQGEYHQDDTFIAEVRLNTEGEYINVAKVDLTFPQDILEVKDFSKGNSILTLWVEEPSFSNQSGRVSFAGGIPAGYQGWDGLLGRTIFRVKQQGTGDKKVKIEFLVSSQVLLNDGLGTPAELKTKGAIFSILPERLEIPPEDKWQEEIEKDNIPPESFKIEVSQDPSVFEGKYFLSFSTTDKQTGVDYYEIKEGERDWKKGESPYLLEDQRLRSIIKVRAVDMAGNERIETIEPPKKPFPYWLILIIIGLVIIIWIIRKLKRSKNLRFN